MKKTVGVLSIILAIIMGFSCLCGCNESTDGTESTAESATKSSEIKIDDIDWKVDEGIIDGERYVMLSYTNNSSFTVSAFKLTFTEKSGLTQEQKNQFYEDIKTISEYDATDSKDVSALEKLKTETITLKVKSEKVCPSGESVTNTKLYYYSGVESVKNIEHYNLVEPDTAEIKYVNNGTIFTVNYDFKSKKYTKDSQTEQAYNWIDKEIGNVIPKPQADIVDTTSYSDDRFSFEIYGWTLEKFNAYVKECQNMGFTTDKNEYKGNYSANNQNGYRLHISYNEDKCSASGWVENKSASSQNG